MSKESAGYLFARVDIDYNTYKQLKEEHEMTLLKVYDKRDRELYKDDAAWEHLNEKVKHYVIEKEERESELRTKTN